jgi:hypothetical protein
MKGKEMKTDFERERELQIIRDMVNNKTKAIDLLYEIRDKLNYYSVGEECFNDIANDLDKLEKIISEN